MKRVKFSTENEGKFATAEVTNFAKEDVTPTESNGIIVIEPGEKSGDVKVSYDYVYDVLETAQELAEKFAPADLLALANARLKSTANSGARQKAIAPFAQDPNSPAAIRETLIKNAVKIGKTLEQATAFVDSLFAS